ncbi:hypothetical protein [Enterococcus sp.]|uniref:hypothetical protein n=1 Tax=Enterococcus sp. TaxID=35783 RepID=UPI002FC5C3AC
MTEITKQDLMDIAFYIGNDAVRELENGNRETAQILWAYRQDILEVLEAEEVRNGKD